MKYNCLYDICMMYIPDPERCFYLYWFCKVRYAVDHIGHIYDLSMNVYLMKDKVEYRLKVGKDVSLYYSMPQEKDSYSKVLCKHDCNYFVKSTQCTFKSFMHHLLKCVDMKMTYHKNPNMISMTIQ